MSPHMKTRLAASAAIALLVGGCASLGGNVKGDFSCRAPEGTCAPTSVIDAEATGSSAAPKAATFVGQSALESSLRTLQIVIAAYRDGAGRQHEARVIRVALPDTPAGGWRAPLKGREVLRSIGNSLSNLKTVEAAAPSSSTPSSPYLPEQLFIPSQPASAEPGAPAPVPGASDRYASPDRVPHTDFDDDFSVSPEEGDRP